MTIQSHLPAFHSLTILLGDFVGFQVAPWLPHQLCFMFISCCQRSVLEWWDFCLKASSYVYSPAGKVTSNTQAPFTIPRKSPSLLAALIMKKLKCSRLSHITWTAFRCCRWLWQVWLKRWEVLCPLSVSIVLSTIIGIIFKLGSPNNCLKNCY